MFDTVEIEETCRKAAGADVALCSSDELLDAAVRLERSISLLQAASAHVVARLDAAHTSMEEFGLNTDAWLAHASRQPRRPCRARVQAAVALARHFGEVDDALSDGRITRAHAEVICSAANPRITGAMVEVQGLFLGWVEEFRFDHWARLVRDVARTLDADGGYDPNEDAMANRLRFSSLPDRTLEVGGQLVGDLSVTVRQSVEQVAHELFRRFAADHKLDPSLEIPPRQVLLALALGEICRRALAVEVGSSRQPRTEAVYVVTVEDGGGETVTGLGGEALPQSGLGVLRCDEWLQALVVDSLGVPLDMGHKIALANADQRRALAVRDGGCVFPGCDRPPGWCDAHHVIHRRHGGPTDLRLLALLCRLHHGVVHRRRWSMEPDPERPGRFLITTPSGRVLQSQRTTRLP